MSKHTQGPWRYRKVKRKQEWEIDTGHCPNLGCDSWTKMAVVFGCDDDPKMGKVVGKANACLIAAAPELLEALEEAVCALEVCGKDYRATEIARAAIAKAKGEQ